MKMSRRKQIVCGIVLLLVAGVAAVAVWQRNNVSAALSFLQYSQEELEEKLTQNDQLVKDAVAAIPEVTVRDVTEEERQALRDGTLTQEELVQNILGTTSQPSGGTAESADKPSGTQTAPAQSGQQTIQKEQTTQPEQATQPEQTPAQPTYQEQMSAIIAEVYVLREEFLIRLDQLKDEAWAAYSALPKEQRTTTAIAKMVSGYLSRGLSLEKECDAKIEAVIIRLEELIQENNGDLSIAQTVYDTYIEEKSLKKAWYMSELKKRGLI